VSGYLSLPGAAIEKESRLCNSAAGPRDIAVGDKAKLYSFQRPDTTIIYVFRIEDRGHR